MAVSRAGALPGSLPDASDLAVITGMFRCSATATCQEAAAGFLTCDRPPHPGTNHNDPTEGTWAEPLLAREIGRAA